MSYHVELAQPNFKSYKIITIFMAFLNAVSFIFYFLNTDSAFLKVVSIVALFASTGLLYVVFVKLYTWSKAFKVVAFLLAFISLCWLFAGNYYLMLLFLALAIFGFFSLKPSIIIFSTDGIQYPSFPTKFYNWQQVNQVIIKDDVLSIDLAENKFLQFLLPGFTVSKIEVPAFNEWCQNKVIAASAG